MPYPVIRINNVTGSDTQASGAGPDPAIYGTQAATDSAGTTVDLSLDNPDLSGVATDGTHVIWLGGTGGREFSPIVGVDNTAKTVTVHSSYPFPSSLSGLQWAIGGKRATLTGVKSALENQDDREYWTVELETDVPAPTSTISLGYSANASILIRSNVPGTKRRISGTADITWLNAKGHVTLVDLFFDRSAATGRGGSSTAVYSGNRLTVIRCKAENFLYGLSSDGGRQSYIACSCVDCGYGFSSSGSAGGTAFACAAISCSYGFSSGSGQTTMSIIGCIAHNCSQYGLHVGGGFDGLILNTVVNGSGSHGIDITGSQHPVKLVNCIVSNNGGYGIKADGNNTQYEVSVVAVNTAFWNNTSGVSDMPNMVMDGVWTTEDPQFKDVAALDFTVQNAVLQEAGVPGVNFIGWGGTNTPLVLDVGAAQPQAGSGSGGTLQGLPFARVFGGM